MVFATLEGLRGGKGRPALPGPARGDRGDREGRGQGPRRGARDRGRGLREDREDERRPRARLGLPRRPGGEADREEAREGRAAREARRGARRRDHGRRHLLPVGLARRAGADEGHRSRRRSRRASPRPRSSSRSRSSAASSRPAGWRRRSRASRRRCRTATSARSTSWSRPWSRTRPSRRRCWPRSRRRSPRRRSSPPTPRRSRSRGSRRALKRPESFCGMHFFNPVPRMPLVEVIRGEKSSEAAIATTVAYAQTLGKTPIVVKDCGGFLVNRVLFPYFAGFELLLRDGVDYERIDKAMEKWGWPMGPALLDRRGRHRHLRPRRHGAGRSLPRPHAPRRPERDRGDGRGGPPGAEERQGLLRLEAREEGPAQQAERPRGQGDRGGARQGPGRGVRRRDRASA